MSGILLLGKFGQLGWELHRSLAPLREVVAIDYPDINLLELDSLVQIIRRMHPEIIINATAYTAVDQAEIESEVAGAINATAPGKLAELAKENKSALIHYSTDYVFDGLKGSPYLESDTPNPLGIYGSSKLAGERAIAEVDAATLVFRTSWVYSLRRDSFVIKVLDWARTQSELRIVDDQVSNPTWCRMLAEATTLLLAKSGDNPAAWINERRGLYHLAGDGFASRLEWARLILDFDPQRDQQIISSLEPAKTRDYPTPAKRPLFSALNCEKFTDTFSIRLPK
ncbi:MAG TPA: dTDP-4-dehydrorhamnose reductase, partial [Anaerolineales bacterium]|nr:dTDP-4-dehydrorhamnose reductase [Anaerolineales bacterium]